MAAKQLLTEFGITWETRKLVMTPVERFFSGECSGRMAKVLASFGMTGKFAAILSFSWFPDFLSS